MTADEVEDAVREAGGHVTTKGTVHARYVSKLLDRDLRTLRRWKKAGTGPACDGVWYSIEALAAWITEQEMSADVMRNVRSRDADPLSAISRREHSYARPSGPCSTRRRIA